MKRFALIILTIALLAATLVCGALLYAHTRERAATYYTDGGAIRQKASAAPIRDVLWEPAAALPEPINTRGDDYEPRLSADGQTLYLVRGRAGGGADIYTATRTPDGWSVPAPFEPANSPADDLGPCPTPDGSAVYFYSDRDGGLGGYDLWVVRRGESGWREPVNLGDAVNSPWNDYGPALAPTGDALYFASNRPRPGADITDPADTWPATLREDLTSRTYDLYAAAIAEGELLTAAALDTLNTDRNEGAPAVSPVGDFVYFASDRPGGRGGFDLYRARRVRGDHLAPENLGEPLNTAANELDPTLSMAGFEMHFSSDRGAALQSSLGGTGLQTSQGGTALQSRLGVDGLQTAQPTAADPLTAQESRQDQTGLETSPIKPTSLVGPESRPTYDIHRSISREVFPEVDRTEAAVDWALLWQRIWPWLGWLAILALLLLLALLALRNPTWRERYGKMGLLARCLVLSVLLHALLMSLLAVWQVGSAVGDIFSKPGGTRVILASSPGGDSLYSQIRGGFTEVPLIQHEAPLTTANIPIDADSPLADLAPPEVTQADEPMQLAEASPAQPPETVPTTAPPPLPQETPAASVALDPALAPQTPRNEAAPDATSARTPNAPMPAAPAPANDATAVRLSPAALAARAVDRPVDAGTSAVSPATSVPQPAAAMAEAPDLPPSPSLAEVAVPAAAAAPGAPQATESALEITAAPSSTGAAVPDAALNAVPGRSLATVEPTQSARVNDGASVATPAPAAVPAPQAFGAASVPSDILPAPADVPQVATPVLDAAVARGEAALDGVPSNSASVPSVAAPDVPAPSTAVTVATSPGSPAWQALSERPMARLDASPVASSSVGSVAIPSPSLAQDGPASPSPTALALPSETAAPQMQARRGAQPEPELGSAALGMAAADSTDRPAPDASAPGASAQPGLREVAPSSRTSTEDRPVANASQVGAAAVSTPAAPATPAPDLPVAAPALAGLALPSEIEPPPQPVDPAEQARLAMQDSIDAALRWLAAHQAADGRWSSRSFDDACGQCADAAQYDLDRASTGLALLAFLGAGHSHAEAGPHQAAVQRGLNWLLDRQRADGDLHTGETMYSEGIAATALAEAAARTRDPALAAPLRAAVASIDAARSPGGGWGAAPGGPGDTTVLGWQVSALVGARRAGTAVPQRTFQAVREWVEAVQVEEGLYAVHPGEGPATWATAECMLARRLLGEPASAPGMEESVEFIAAELPGWNRALDTYTWHFITLALRHHGGEAWDRWGPAVVDQLLAHQRRDGRAAGSWDVAGDPTAAVGGRVYQTAMATLIVEAVLRDPPGYIGGVGGSPGTLSGRVFDALDDQPISGATVRLDLPDGDTIIVQTGPDGRYALRPVDVPAHVAVSASAPGYTPESIDVAERDLVAGLRRDFRLSPVNRNVVAMESDPQVHHLGDDEWSGRINSQFQRRSEGQVYQARFALAPDQAPPHLAAAEVRILAKGTQAQNEVRINGHLVERRLTGSPADGSFGEWRAEFPAEWLVAGDNTIEVRGVYGQVDYDDFEFVNVRVVLTTLAPEPTGP